MTDLRVQGDIQEMMHQAIQADNDPIEELEMEEPDQLSLAHVESVQSHNLQRPMSTRDAVRCDSGYFDDASSTQELPATFDDERRRYIMYGQVVLHVYTAPVILTNEYNETRGGDSWLQNVNCPRKTLKCEAHVFDLDHDFKRPCQRAAKSLIVLRYIQTSSTSEPVIVEEEVELEIADGTPSGYMIRCIGLGNQTMDLKSDVIFRILVTKPPFHVVSMSECYLMTITLCEAFCGWTRSYQTCSGRKCELSGVGMTNPLHMFRVGKHGFIVAEMKRSVKSDHRASIQEDPTWAKCLEPPPSFSLFRAGDDYGAVWVTFEVICPQDMNYQQQETVESILALNFSTVKFRYIP
ncbi:hypothetical protein EK21DRAFT_93122 [Setomelanomma holmii]|uniref:Uncharacterized protein n=1 Tax=Setomelanomma holmii TaxID=210430 RepID=A0A9P4GZL4_9PLEO|nr:hypothetical protein EK21DRAFT_93122 [Setomelanomma holmii]